MTSTSPPIRRQLPMALLFLAIVIAVAILGSLATIPNTENGWYADAEKVAWSPPNWLFGPAWSLLYLFIAVSGFLIWRAGYRPDGASNRAHLALTLFAIQMVLNLAWTPIFFAGFPIFGAVAWWAALVIMAALIVFVVALIMAAKRHSKLAMWLLVPYLGWLLFASTLNMGIIALN